MCAVERVPRSCSFAAAKIVQHQSLACPARHLSPCLMKPTPCSCSLLLCAAAAMTATSLVLASTVVPGLQSSRNSPLVLMLVGRTASTPSRTVLTANNCCAAFADNMPRCCWDPCAYLNCVKALDQRGRLLLSKCSGSCAPARASDGVVVSKHCKHM